MHEKASKSLVAIYSAAGGKAFPVPRIFRMLAREKRREQDKNDRRVQLVSCGDRLSDDEKKRNKKKKKPQKNPKKIVRIKRSLVMTPTAYQTIQNSTNPFLAPCDKVRKCQRLVVLAFSRNTPEKAWQSDVIDM